MKKSSAEKVEDFGDYLMGDDVKFKISERDEFFEKLADRDMFPERAREINEQIWKHYLSGSSF